MGVFSDLGNTATFNMFKGPEQPGIGPADVDYRTTALINAQAARAQETPEETYNKSLEGVDQSAAVVPSLQNMEIQQSALGGNEQAAFRDALRSRAEKSYGMDLNKIQRQTRMNAPVKNFELKQQATSNAQKVFQYKQDYLQRQRQQAANDKAARNAVIGSVLGVAGAIGGGMAGGPMGAGVGMQAGSALGSMGG